MIGRDVIAIGGSAGAREALSRLVAALSEPLDAVVLVTIHVSAIGGDSLPRLLSLAGPMPAAHAVNGERPRRGRIYIAPPDRHLLVDHGRLFLSEGPRENRFRPAVDPLFRSVADEHGPRSVGVVLSGMLDDGAYGLRLIKRRGGVAVVQSPEDATAPGMPESALLAASVDFILPASAIGDALHGLATGTLLPPPPQGDPDGPAMNDSEATDFSGAPPSAFVCPECGGTLFERADDGMFRFRCRVGHVFTEGGLRQEHKEGIEAALWTALRTLEETEDLHQRLVSRARTQGTPAALERLERDLSDAERKASSLRRLLLGDENR